MNNDKADFTQGSILKKLIAFMIPVLGALILQAAYGAVDLLVVGRFGSTSGLSAVSTGSQVLNLVTFVVIQFAMGITVLIARYLGEKKPQQIGAVVGYRHLFCRRKARQSLFLIRCRAAHKKALHTLFAQRSAQPSEHRAKQDVLQHQRFSDQFSLCVIHK